MSATITFHSGDLTYMYIPKILTSSCQDFCGKCDIAYAQCRLLEWVYVEGPGAFNQSRCSCGNVHKSVRRWTTRRPLWTKTYVRSRTLCSHCRNYLCCNHFGRSIKVDKSARMDCGMAILYGIGYRYVTVQIWPRVYDTDNRHRRRLPSERRDHSRVCHIA
jgi:hypothetical protein